MTEPNRPKWLQLWEELTHDAKREKEEGHQMVKNVALAVTVFLLLSSLGVVGFAAAPQSSESYVHPLTTTTGAVYFNETGLASGTSWSVVYNSLNESSTSSSIKFTETALAVPVCGEGVYSVIPEQASFTL